MLTASRRSKAFTTEPEGSRSILSAPALISLTLATKSPANSWKMSFAGQVLWNFQTMASCARTIFGMASAPAAALAATPPAFRNFRRETSFSVIPVMSPSRGTPCWSANPWLPVFVAFGRLGPPACGRGGCRIRLADQACFGNRISSRCERSARASRAARCLGRFVALSDRWRPVRPCRGTPNRNSRCRQG